MKVTKLFIKPQHGVPLKERAEVSRLFPQNKVLLLHWCKIIVDA
ncbi:MAG: hypothetical protein ACBR20_11605 [Microcoleus sp.]